MKYKWHALAEVVPAEGNPDVLEGASGALVNVIALARDIDEVQELTKNSLDEFGLNLIDLSDVKLITSKVTREGGLSDEMLELAALLSETNPVQFSTFDAYP
ncbi:hypothetical protein [uncultured Roseibium sp.]|uniref:hypothetical protein n=1 Tax=uncultured Roseibium sp. TaxID=1936171 RepID=UPI0032180FCD